MGNIIDSKKELMSKINIGDVVILSKIDGKRFLVEYLDNRNFLVGIRGIHINKVDTNGVQYGQFFWVNPEDIIIANNRYKVEKTYNLRTNIKKVIFNSPATIVFWSDGSKTVVKAHNDDYDPEKGLAMAIAKKALGNEGNYYNVFKKWLPKDGETIETDQTSIYELFYDQKVNDILNKALEDIKNGIKNRRGLLENDKY